jgi:DNA polymerase I-like protein with 3'-5' exonuclease and polymerase domains
VNKLITGIPPEAYKNEFVAMDVETFGQENGKVHRPTGTFACLSIALERDPDTRYQIYDSHDIRHVLSSAKQGTWVFHNALYDLRQLGRFHDIKPRYIFDIMLVEQSLYGGYYTYFNLKDMSRRYLNIIVNKETRDYFSTSTEMSPSMKEYAADDATDTVRIAMRQRDMFADTNRLDVYKHIDEPMIWPLLDIKGTRIDVGAWTKAVDEFKIKADQLQDELGFNVYSPQQVLKALGKHGLHVRNTNATTLKAYAKDELVSKVLETRMYRKAVSTYGLNWLEENVEEDGMVYPSWHITGANTGRMSCVSGSTIIQTNRGKFRMEDYLPIEGDYTLTHLGNNKPILRKIYKGLENMVRVECSDGSVVECTQDHKLQTPQGWVRVGDLHISSEVYTYVNLEGVRQQQEEYRNHPAIVFGGRPQVWISTDSRSYRYDLSQRSLHRQQLCGRGTQERRAEYSNVAFQDGSIESRTSEEASQLQGVDRGRARIRSDEDQWEIHVRAPESDGAGIGTRGVATVVGRASHRRGQTEQRPGQFSIGDECWTSEIAQKISTITSITFMGAMDVWDIEVADDHSYLAGGLIHHNSSNPNGQNIPARKLPIYRSFFIPSDDHVMTIEDVTQQEPCILGFESQDPVLLEAINKGEDLHQAIADAIHQPRHIGKAINLGIGYGLTPQGMSDRLDMELEECEHIINSYFTRFRGVFGWISNERSFASSHGYVETASKRRVHINPYDSQWQNNAINSPIQGGAADFTKVWVRKFWEKTHKIDLYSLCLIVHDEIVKDAPRDGLKETNEASDAAFHETAEMLYSGVPFRYEREVGRSWAAKGNIDERYEEDEDE